MAPEVMQAYREQWHTCLMSAYVASFIAKVSEED